jgi:imidazolonepropionase-like amidohydrolase
MSAAGVQVAIRTAEAENVRNLPFHAGFATTYGMPRQKAIEAITIVPARIFGLNKDYGSIEVGKVANLLVADGDPLETRTQVEHVFIAGKKMPNYNRHIGLYEEFLKRDPGLSRE